MRLAAAIFVVLAPVLASGVPASAQLKSPGSGNASGSSMGALIADGYEIKAAAPNGSKYVVFLQKDKKAFACEFVTLANSRCGEVK